MAIELQVAEPDLLRRGLTAMGLQVQEIGPRWVVTKAGRAVGTWVDGKFWLERGVPAEVATEIQAAYGDQVIFSVAQRFNLRLTADPENENARMARF
jgi:hypothetical protein